MSDAKPPSSRPYLVALGAAGAVVLLQFPLLALVDPPRTVALVISASLLGVGLVVLVVTRVKLHGHQKRVRQFYRDNPAARPSKRTLALRMTPFALLCAAFAVLGVVRDQPGPILVGVLGVIAFVIAMATYDPEKSWERRSISKWWRDRRDRS